jgi:aldose sugar dehydrogenase
MHTPVITAFKSIICLFCIALSSTMIAYAEKSQIILASGKQYRVVTVSDNLDHPWSLAFLPDKSFLVTERSGHLLKISRDGTKREEISGLPVIAAEDQGGLLDVVLAPDFPVSRTLFFSFTAKTLEGAGTEVARAQLNGTALNGVRIIFRALPKTSANKHFGSRILIAPDGTLFITLGEKTIKKEAQNRTNHLGSIIRINPDGTVPKDNPFVTIKAFKPEIYTFGNRNVQGIVLHPVTHEIWFHEHGPFGGDELNILKKGANYGWPLVTYGNDYDGTIISDKTILPGIEPPLLYWTPCIAPSGMTFYTGNRYPEWKGNLFVGSLVQTHLRRVVLNGTKVVGQQVLFRELGERIRDVRQGPDGYLYLLTDNDNGRILRIDPAK